MERMAPFLCLILGALIHFSPLALAQGGPPFRSDDPDTPGNKLWEINTLLIGSRNPSEGSYETPLIDVNYGLGNRIQLKYEVPLSIHESRGIPGHVAAGLGNSLLGVKWRFYAYHLRTGVSDQVDKRESNFGMSIYPQVALNHPTHSVRRGIADPRVPAPAETRQLAVHKSARRARFPQKQTPKSALSASLGNLDTGSPVKMFRTHGYEA